MQQQITRIRNTNYSNIDQKMHINVGITNQLQCSITKLTQLQCFLKSQINSIQDQGIKQVAINSSPVIVKMGLDNQRDINIKCQCFSTFKQILQRIKKIRKLLKTTKQNIAHQLSDFLTDLKDIFNDNFIYLTNLTSRKINETNKYKSQIQNMKMQIDDLKYKNVNLSLKIQQWQQAKKRRDDILEKNCEQQSIMSIYTITQGQQTQRQTLVNINNICNQFSKTTQCIPHINQQKYYFSSHPNQNNQQQSDNDTPPLPMPLRKQSLASRQATKTYSKQRLKQKQKQNNKEYCTTVKNSPTKLKIVWNQGSINTSPFSHKKQNQLLKTKGSAKNHKKSTKKLKLFSLM